MGICELKLNYRAKPLNFHVLIAFSGEYNGRLFLFYCTVIVIFLEKNALK